MLIQQAGLNAMDLIIQLRPDADSKGLIFFRHRSPAVGNAAIMPLLQQEIGEVPVLSFGNSSGDYSMLNYAEGNPDHPGMGILVGCDDTVREYGSETKAADFYAEVEKQGWTAFSMANDWLTIYGDGVEKVGLPGAEEEALPDAA